MRGSSLKEQLWVLVYLGCVRGHHTRFGCLGRADLLSHQEDEESACPGLGEECPCLAWDLPIFRFQDGHNENLWGLRWLFRKNRNEEDMIVRVHVLMRVGKGQSWFYLNKIVYVTVMLTAC